MHQRLLEAFLSVPGKIAIIETIRYYEKIGVMPKPARSAAGYRVYGNDHTRRLHFVRRCRQLGFRLDELRDLLALLMGMPTLAGRSTHLPSNI
jgi:DNA-binding transcriptional MerR regulator